MAKYRQGFVSNSSSSSFVIINAGNHIILEHGDTDIDDGIDSITVNINNFIDRLIQARNSGEKTVVITHGGGYDG